MNKITREELVEWKAHPTTAKVMAKVVRQVASIRNDLADGVSIGESLEETFRRTARMVGQIEGLKQLLSITDDEEEEGTDAWN